MRMSYALLVAGLLAGAAGTAWAQDNVSPGTRWAQVAACAGERSAESRHACVDGILRAAGALSPVQEAAATRENFGRSERAVAATVAAVAAPAAPAPAAPAAPAAAVAPPAARPVVPAPAPVAVAPAPPAPVTGITTTVASARLGGARKVIVTTAEGAVWQQADNDVIRRLPRAGESFEVREGALGSYRCTFDGSTTFRCERRD